MTNLYDSLQLEFAIGGLPGTVLRRHFLADAHAAKLSTSFRLYYQCRAVIPVRLRQLLQRLRNRRLRVAADWFLPNAFIDDFSAALRREFETQRDVVVIHPWPDEYQFASVLTHDVETKRGLKLVARLADMEEQLGLRSAWNIVPYKYRIDKGLIVDLQRRGFEIGIHGYNHDGKLFASRRKFRRRVPWMQRALQEYDSCGFRAPMMHRDLEWLQELEIEYDSSCFDIDPFQAMPGGVGGIWPFLAGRFVELPCTLPQDHTLFALGEQDANIWQNKLRLIRRWSGLALMLTHPDYLDTPRRLDIYRQFLLHLQEQPRQWSALPRDIADWWRKRAASRIVSEDGHRIHGPASERGQTIKLSQWFGDVLQPRQIGKTVSSR